MPHLDHFSLIAPFYDRIFGRLDVTRLRELLALPAGRLLDVGGGTGRVAATLAGEFEHVVLADPSQAMLSGARAKVGLKPARAHAERLPFADGSFDRVLVVDAFHHFAHQEQAAAEMLRVLAPGGRLVVEEMNYERLPVKLVALGEKALLMGSRFHGPDGLRRLFEGRGATVTVRADSEINVWVMVEKQGGQT